MKTFKEEIAEIIMKPEKLYSGEEIASQIIQSLLNRLPKEKDDNWRYNFNGSWDEYNENCGYNACLKELIKILTGEIKGI